MKCEHCGGNLTLETLSCPYCGKVNPHAQQHASDMRKYQGAFADTRSDVYSVVRKFSGITARAVIIVILLFAIVAAAVISSEAYSIHRNMEQTNSRKHMTEYMAIMDAYLQEEDYLSFEAFCETHYIDGYDDGYEKYRPVISAASQYSVICYYLMGFATAEDREEQERILGYMSDSVGYFYKYMDIELFKYYEGAVCEENVQILQRMEDNLLAMLQAYCGLSAEDAEGFGELSQAKRMVLIEERLDEEQE